MSQLGQSRRFGPICVGSGLPPEPTCRRRADFVAKGHKRTGTDPKRKKLISADLTDGHAISTGRDLRYCARLFTRLFKS
jgi:hypothetical protein